MLASQDDVARNEHEHGEVRSRRPDGAREGVEDGLMGIHQQLMRIAEMVTHLGHDCSGKGECLDFSEPLLFIRILLSKPTVMRTL